MPSLREKMKQEMNSVFLAMPPTNEVIRYFYAGIAKKTLFIFFPVGDIFKDIFIDWVNFIKDEKHLDYESPLFPKTKLELDQEHWQSTTPIREIMESAFESAGFARYTPHTFRNTLTHLSYERCKTPEHLKAWSQNLGHNSPLTTLTSYGHIPVDKRKG